MAKSYVETLEERNEELTRLLEDQAILKRKLEYYRGLHEAELYGLVDIASSLVGKNKDDKDEYLRSIRSMVFNNMGKHRLAKIESEQDRPPSFLDVYDLLALHNELMCHFDQLIDN